MERDSEGGSSAGSSPRSSASGSPAHRNPSPPDSEEEGLAGDPIGSTAYSRRWLLGALARLATLLGGGEASLGEALEAELCELWDMSADLEVALLLLELQAPHMLLAAATAPAACPRLAEVCLGILGNMACFPDPCVAISALLAQVLPQLLHGDDSPTLLEASRLLLACLSQGPEAQAWLQRIHECPAVRSSVCFIMSSSTCAPLLLKVGELTDKLFDLDEELMLDWIRMDAPATDESEEDPPAALQLVLCLLEAAKQLRSDSPEGLDIYMHLLQLLTTVDEGIQAILQPPEVGRQTWEFLSDLMGHELCQADDPPIIIQEQKTVLASVLAVMSAMFSSRADEEYMKVETNLPLVGSVMQVLQHMEDCQPKPLEKAQLSQKEVDKNESAYEQDFHLKILKDIACEFLSNILLLLTKENIFEGQKHGHLNEQKCLCAVRNLLPLYLTAVQTFTAVLYEADQKLAETLKEHFPTLEDPAQ